VVFEKSPGVGTFGSSCEILTSGFCGQTYARKDR